MVRMRRTLFSGVSAFEESEIVVEAYKRFKFGAGMLEVIIRIRYELSVSHNHIHRCLMYHGLGRAEESKRKQRK